jgi:hypothetical protein
MERGGEKDKKGDQVRVKTKGNQIQKKVTFIVEDVDEENNEPSSHKVEVQEVTKKLQPDSPGIIRPVLLDLQEQFGRLRMTSSSAVSVIHK